MLDAFQPVESILWDYFWQSTVLLGVGLGASVALARRPARAHRVLVLAILAALATPILAQVARRGGWGLLTHSAATPATRVRSGASIASVANDSLAIARVSLPSSALARANRLTEAHGVNTSDTASHSGQFVVQPSRLSSVRRGKLALGGWLFLSGLAVARLVTSLFLGVSLVRRARLLNDKALTIAAAAAVTRLDVIATAELRVSPRMPCPSIWCWGRRPVIVLPEGAAAATSINWVGVFCHELAHWLRRDHWSSLAGEILACALPWHPLAWWARHRLGQLSELACDDWVLATGLPATEYADSLLSLIPQRRGSMALAAVSRRRGLFGRVRHILDERRASPVVGRRWACSSAAAMILAASAVALAQSRGKQSKDQVRESEANTKTASVLNRQPASLRETASKRTIKGTVIGLDGKATVGATIFWIAEPKPPLPSWVVPKDRDSSRSNQAEILAGAETGADGKFSLSADYESDRYQRYQDWEGTLLAIAAGAGMVSQPLKVDAAEAKLRLAPEVVIRGRLLTPSGMPAAGVRVTLDSFLNDENDETTQGMSVGMIPADDQVPRYWPKPRTTDADGRFTLEGVPQGFYATLTFWHPDYAVDEVTVNGMVDGSITQGLRAFEIKPVKPTFAHTLEPPRPVQGRVTDKETGKPLAGLLVEMIPMRRHGGMPFHTRTDADGRYRVAGHAGADSYFTSIYPPADSGYLAPSDNDQKWPVGAKFLEKNFALEKGRIVRGQIVDADTKQPIAGAAVAYQPKQDNPNTRNYNFRNSVLADSEGRFAITVLPGQGFLAVETADETRVRVPLGEDDGYERAYPQGCARIDVSKEGEPKRVEIAVRKGTTLVAKALGPDGKAVLDLVGFCEGIGARLIDFEDQGQPFPDGVFRLPGTDPSRTYRVYLLQPERRLGAVVDIKPDPQATHPIEVKLQPTAKVHGKVVTAAGTPMQGGQVYPLLMLRSKKGQMSRDEVLANSTFYVDLIGQKSMMVYSEKQKANAHGEFVIDTLLPGVPLYVMAAGAGREAAVPLPLLMPGEDRDLGTIILTETKP